LPTTPSLRSISVTVSTRSVAVAPSRSLPVSLKPTTWGTSMETGWPSMAASASMPPTPQPSTPRPLIMVVWESVPTSVSGYACGLCAAGGEDDAGQVFEVDLVADAHAGRDGREVAERGLAPLEEGVALAVALEFEGGVEVVGVAGAEFVDLDGVVDDQLRGLERVDLLRIAAEQLHGIAHGGEVDHRGDAGEVLHEDAAGIQEISREGSAFGSHLARNSMSPAVTDLPSS
jgi:hypothetical protein